MKYYRTSIIFIILNIFFISNLFSQSPDVDYNEKIKKYSISSPDVYSFEKLNLNPVNHFVGKANISVPIFTIKTGNIEYPITLNYDTGGIKVDQIASNVGLGWSLSSAMITRTIQNANDFDNTGDLQNPDYSSLPQLESQKNYQAFQNNGYTSKTGYFLQKTNNTKMDENHKQVDFLPDIYNFYSPEFKTKFFYEDIGIPVEMEPKGTSIHGVTDLQKIPTNRGYFASNSWHYNHNLYTKDFFNFNIVSNNGIKYSFNDCDFSYNEQFQVGTANNFVNNSYEKVDSPAQISAWHISEILDRNSEKKINFIYETTHSNTNGSNNSGFDFKASQMSYSYTTIPDLQDLNNCHYYAPWNDFTNGYLLSASARVDVVRKILKKIVFDEGSIEFNYNHEGIGGPGIARMDVANGSFITQIYVKDKHNEIITSFNLNYDKFQSDYNVGEFNPFNEYSSYRYTRLKLVSIEEVGKPAYEFEYDESIKLPPVNSFSVDFTGYFNNSNDITSNTDLISNKKHPQLYYYPNQFEKSLLPFPITGMSYTTIPGHFNRQANNFSKAWSLKRIKYPTGGYSELEYESNSFKVFNQEVNGGGIRLKRQVLKDENLNIVKEMNYSYENIDGIASGTLFSYPYFGHPLNQFFNSYLYYSQDYEIDPIFDPENPLPPSHPFDTDHWKLFDKSNLLEDITSSSFVGYSKVTEIEAGNGKKEFTFTSNDLSGFENEIVRYDADNAYVNIINFPSYNYCINDFLITNSAFGANIFTDNSYKRGKLLLEKVYDEDENLIKEIENEYQDNVYTTLTFKQPTSKQRHTQNVEKTMKFITMKKKYRASSFLPIKKTVRTFSNNEEINSLYNYTYNSDGLVKTIEKLVNGGEVNKTEYYYPTDVVDLNSLPGTTMNLNDLSMYQYLVSPKNNRSAKIQINNYLGSNLLSTYRETYRIFNPVTNYQSTVTPNEVYASKANGPLERKIRYNKYDDKNNLIEYTIENDKAVSLIWGYNKTQLVAKIENAAYASLPTSIIQGIETASNDNDETELLLALNNLRTALPNAMVTTYTYKLLVGVTSITDPRGYITTYQYDDFNRLESIKDANGIKVSKNEYHYKN